MLSERQQKILQLVVDKYISTSQPVSSEGLAEKVGVSSATIRNEMAEMTDMGYLAQPHTSAGRIVSEKGWQYYVEQLVNLNKQIGKKVEQDFEQLHEQDERDYARHVAKKVVEHADAAVMIAFAPRDLYYTGLTNLFSQPEFHELQTIVHVSQVIDHLDDMMVKVFDDLHEHQILIGEQNAFSPECSAVVSPFQQENHKGLFVILGPLRMNYAFNSSLAKYAAELLSITK